VSGNDESYKKLEDKLAKHKSHQNSLIYPTGYMANLGAISALAKKGDLILSDELNHASIIESCKLSDAKVSIYKHNDMEDLNKKLKQKGKNKFVITEGIFSMDGDLSSLNQIAEISEKSNAITIVDDAHGDFVIGRDGKGTPDHFRIAKKIDLYISSLSKGLGSFGGYVSSQSNVIDLCINKSKSFIYTSALPSFLVEYSMRRFESNREKQKKKLEKNTKQISKGLRQIGYEINSNTQIIPIIAGNEKSAMDFGKFLFKNGIFAQPIRYPTVPKNQARLRISVTAWLSSKDIEKSLEIFEKAHRKFYN
jgi:glycine C-acetyltransferase